MSNRVTIGDVAKIAGVSIQTVSRVLNKKGEVSATTRAKVLAIIEETGYRRSSVARSLATSRTLTIGLVVPDLTNPFFSDITHSVEQAAYANGYRVILCNSDENLERELTILQWLEEARVDGLIACGSRNDTERLSEVFKRFPAVTLVNLNGGDSLSRVIVDDVSGGSLATRHLLARGHTAIGFLAGPDHSYSGNRRRQGYRLALLDAGLSPDPDWLRSCRPTVDGGESAAKDLLTQHPQLTALFCFNDLVAVGALRACTALNLAVPQDIAIIGNDDIRLAALVTPALTTIRLPRQKMGADATRLLLNQIEGCEDDCTEIEIKPELIVRASAP